MRFGTHIPAAPLRDFIADFWLYEDYTPSSHLKERILPSGTIEMVINLQDDELRIYDAAAIHSCKRFSGALVSGTYGGCFATDTAEEKCVMGVHFKPGGAFPFLGLPPDELADAHIDLETLWGRSARELRERLCEATTPAQRFRILEEALLGRVVHPLEHHWAVAASLEEFGQGVHPMVREMAKHLGLSQRRLISVFAAEVGLTPKLFGRIRRFQRALVMAAENMGASDWAQISLSCGYYDQSHLISDFVEFSGLTPAEYIEQLGYLDQRGVRRKRNHLPLVAAEPGRREAAAGLPRPFSSSIFSNTTPARNRYAESER